ncbi:MAG: CoA-transferase [Saccharofermentanales bacterium]
MPKFIEKHEIPALVKNDCTICTVGMTLISSSETTLKALEKSFLETGEPKNLTLLHSAGQSDRKNGIQHFAHEGFVTRIYGSHWGLQPRWMEMIANNKVEAFCLPQGQITHLYRAMAGNKPGMFSKVGLGTYIDPRVEGGKMNDITKPLDPPVDIIELYGEEYMFYKAIPIDVCIIRGTKCDQNGNLSFEEEAMKLEVLPAVLATKNNGGIVIAQVKRVVENGTINPKLAEIPGVFIDYVVVCDNLVEDHRQTSSWYLDLSFSGQERVPQGDIKPVPFSERKYIGRRACMELRSGNIINLGTGIPNDTVGGICNEEGVEDVMITVESGIYGGVSAGGIDFGIGQNLQAMIRHDEQMDFYNGAGCDITFMGFGEIDQYGNVNATKMGSACTGCGGFIDLTQNARKVVFCGTFMAKAKYDFTDDEIVIKKEGTIKKFVKNVNQISFNGKQSVANKQEIYYVTERAVFTLTEEGVKLIEIAPGIDLQTQILDLMDFEPIIADDLKVIDPDLLIQDGTYGLKEKMAK